MAIHNFRILLETVEGGKTSYYSSSFVDTSTDLVLSASQVYHRITSSVSASYQNNSIFSGSNVNTNFTFKDNTLLSASLSGSLDTGSIQFTALDTEYDRLLRYKFIGDKVCNVLGLPSNQWVYVDQFRLPADDEANFIEGNIKGKNAFFSDTITFANTSNVNSDISFLIDTGSDRYIKFVDERNIPEVALRMGYDVDTDVYEISGSDNFTFNMGNVNNLRVADYIYHQGDDDTNIQFAVDRIIFNVGGISFLTMTESPSSQDALTVGDGSDIDFRLRLISGSNALFVEGSSGNVGIGTNVPDKALDVVGDIRATGDVISNRYVVSSSVSHITQSFSSGSTIFGDTLNDTHQFTGSVFITASNSENTKMGLIVDGNISSSLNIILEESSGKLKLNGNVDDDQIYYASTGGIILDSNEGITTIGNLGIGETAHPKALTVAGDISASGDLYSQGSIKDITHITASGNISSSGGESTFGQVVNMIGTDPRLRLKAVGANHPGVEWWEDSTRKWVVYNDPDESDKLVFKNDSTELLKLTQAGNLGVTEEIYHIEDTDTKITFTADDINITVGGVNMIDFTEGANDEITINEAAADLDVRIEGEDDPNLLFTDATTPGRVGIGTNTPTTKLQVEGDISASGDILTTQVVKMTNSSSVINTFNTGSFKTCKYILQVTSASHIQSSEMLVMQHGSRASNTEYAQLNSGVNLLNFATSISGPNVKLEGSGDFISCSVKFVRKII